MAIYAWFSLVTDRLPTRDPSETVALEVDATMSPPTPGAALLRVLTGLPSALALAVLAWIGGVVWVIAAILVLIKQSFGDWAYDYLAGLQRWTARLLVYQAALVETYPPFSFAEQPRGELPAARAL
jgi:hypothetical protein